MNQSSRTRAVRPLWYRVTLPALAVATLGLCIEFAGPLDRQTHVEAKEKTASANASANTPAYTVLGYPELGMHCMNQDFSEICILPPFNTLRAQVIQRGEEPRIVTSNVTVQYSIPGNTTSQNKTNFWVYAPKLFGANVPPDIGLTGNGLTGKMKPTGNQNWSVTGIPITPLDDNLKNNPFQLSHIQVNNSRGQKLAESVAVVPVSWEINCNLCHNTPGISVATDILRKHDRLHGTKLEQQKPVLCASCHADPALGTSGVTGVKAFSHAMHGSHASRMTTLTGLSNAQGLAAALNLVDPAQAEALSQASTAAAATQAVVLKNACYACHPGVNTECQRDVHLPHGITCVNCHGDMKAVGAVSRKPWVDEPTCAQCHKKINPRFDYEQTGKLFKDSKGHGGIDCASCHGPQHAVGPATTAPDNAQALLQQGQAGPISKCTVCHTRQPGEPFFHSRED